MYRGGKWDRSGGTGQLSKCWRGLKRGAWLQTCPLNYVMVSRNKPSYDVASRGPQQGADDTGFKSTNKHWVVGGNIRNRKRKRLGLQFWTQWLLPLTDCFWGRHAFGIHRLFFSANCWIKKKQHLFYSKPELILSFI